MSARGWRGVDLAGAADVTPAAVSRYLNGRLPGSDELYRLAKALETSMEFLFSGERLPTATGSDSEDVVAYRARPTPLLPDPGDLDQVIRELEGNLDLLRRFRASFDADPAPGKKVVPFKPAPGPRAELPFYGWVAAGKPSDVDFHSGECMTVPGDYGRRPHYLLRVRGRSMEPDYPEGSYVVVRALAPGEYATKGDIVIANDANGPAMKRLEYRKDGRKGDTPRKPTPHLVSINPDFGEVVPVSDCPIQGIVVECLEADFFDV